MNAHRSRMLCSALAIGLLAASGTVIASEAALAPQNDMFGGRHADHLPVWSARASESAEFAAMEASPGATLSEPAYSGRRADHIPHVLGIGKARAEFAAMEATAAQPVTEQRNEPAYGGRRADHLELLR